MDSIGDLLARINNALKVHKESVELPHSRVKEEIVKILMAEGFVGKYDTLTRMNKKHLRVALKYTETKKSVIAGIKRVSRPGRKIYVGIRSIPRVQGGFGTAILSTSKGLMTDEEAREKKLGGEVLCYIW